MVLPLFEQRTELVGGRTPVRVVAQIGGELLGLLHDLRALGHGFGHRFLAGLRDAFLLGLGFGLEFVELGVQRGDVAHHIRVLGFRGERLQRLIDLARLNRVRLQARGEQVQLRLEVEVTASIQCERLIVRGVRVLAHFTLGVAFLDIHHAVVVHTAEAFGLGDVRLGESARLRDRRMCCGLGQCSR